MWLPAHFCTPCTIRRVVLVSTYWVSHPLTFLSLLCSGKCNKFRMLYFYHVFPWCYVALTLTSLVAHPHSDVYSISFTLQSLCSLLLFVVLIAQRGSIKTCINLNCIAGALSCLEAVHCVTWQLHLIRRGLIALLSSNLTVTQERVLPFQILGQTLSAGLRVWAQTYKAA